MKLSQSIVTQCSVAQNKIKGEVDALVAVLNVELPKLKRTRSDMQALIFLEGKLDRVIGFLESLQGKLEYIQSKAVDISDRGDAETRAPADTEVAKSGIAEVATPTADTEGRA